MKKREWEFKMKKDLIADAAADLFLEKGVENVTLSEIASQVGYSKSSLYSYFKSRDDIISYLVELADEEFQGIESFITEQLKKIEPGESESLFDVLFDESFRKTYRNKKVATLFHKNIGLIYQNNGVIFEKIMGIYEKRIKFLSGVLKAYIRDVKKATLVSYLVMGVLQGMEHYKMMEENSMENEKAYQIMKNFLKSALGENTEEEK
ncbi:MAG TPA: TetR/AcrR family transcriptional regulator [Candidatus Mcinerneyibacteriales bacterium]|nr:TetR/AcrR family transcriptional regulator [Candidatus Mcinerneyibacteriales bacterium]